MEKVLAEIGFSKLEQPDDEQVRVKEDLRIVRLDPDVAAIFKDSEMVNRALRKLIRIMTMVDEKRGASKLVNDH